MDQASIIVREPLLDPKERLLGYELTWQKSSISDGGMGKANDLMRFVVEQIQHPDLGWQLVDSTLCMEVTAASIAAEVIGGLPPKTTMLKLGGSDLAEPEIAATLKALRQQGFGISANYADLAGQDKSLLSLLTNIDIRFSAMDIATLTKLSTALKSSSIRLSAREVGDWQAFDACASLGMNVFGGTFYLMPRPGAKSKGLNPAQAMILQLMQLVRQNADIRQLEDILRRDAALSYKLLRYINSVGFGLGAEIQSLRHAVTMLGYSPLYRWLSLLLATASASGFSPALMQAAVVRGRFAELLGQGLLPKNEAENLFVAGMFSLLDRFLGVPMEEVLENIQLSDAVSEALLTRGGMYGPFLALAEACELKCGNAGALADALFISANQVNEAHLAALVWAQSLKL